MAIEIFSYELPAKDALFPAIQNNRQLIAVAPVSRKADAETWCDDMNRDAEKQGSNVRFKSSITFVEIWE